MHSVQDPPTPTPDHHDEALASLLAMIRDAIEDNKAQQIATAAIARSLSAGLKELRRTEASLVAAMTPAVEWDDLTVADLRLADVVKWQGSRVASETVLGLGRLVGGRRNVATDYLAAEMDGSEPVKVRLPRPSDRTGLEVVGPYMTADGEAEAAGADRMLRESAGVA